jgi:lytic murein transglycosylase
MDNQPEFKTPIWDYISVWSTTNASRTAVGDAPARAGARHGGEPLRVDRHIIAGVWGVESNFGKDIGGRPLVQSLGHALLRAEPPPRLFSRRVLRHAADHRARRHRPNRLNGSWAGAFGHTQFMPSTFQRLAVDLDGDGRRDVVDSVPDAVGSTANFLRKAGLEFGLPWGYEVQIPDGYSGPSGRKNKRPLSAWSAAGVTRIDGRALSGDYQAGLLLPAGKNGPAFLVTKNFDALYSYNAAESYGLAIALLSERLRGNPGIQTAWPTDDPPLNRAERRELQRLLAARGHDVGEPDGRVGQKTRDAVKQIERQIGMSPTGRPGGKVLQALRGR